MDSKVTNYISTLVSLDTGIQKGQLIRMINTMDIIVGVTRRIPRKVGIWKSIVRTEEPHGYLLKYARNITRLMYHSMQSIIGPTWNFRLVGGHLGPEAFHRGI